MKFLSPLPSSVLKSTLLSLALVAPLSIHAQEDEVDSVGLVLAGGGARGIAHAGAILALEELQIPIHAIAGTSMGALVGGLYASGRDAEQLKKIIDEMDWKRAFEDSLDRNDTPQRRKSDDYDYPLSVRLTIKDGTASIPMGIVQGQQTRQIIKELMLNADHIRNFDQLPIPYRAVATDIETGDAYIFDQGDIVTAMRASMSLPALLAPVEHEGRLLVDGGMAMNIPVAVGRDMGTSRLIVIDIGTPLRDRDEITSVLGIADQMLGFLTRKNSIEQLQTLSERDILINPDLTGIGMLDFDQAELIFQRGYDATIALREKLLPLAIDDRQWKQYLAGRSLPDAATPRIDKITIANNSKVSDALIRTRLRQKIGEPLNRAQLDADIAKIYTLDYWEIIDSSLSTQNGQNNLIVTARAKTWGSDNLKVGMNLLTDLDGSSDINLGVSYLNKGLNDLGGELYGRAQVGDTLILAGELYQPLDVNSRFFVTPSIGYRDHEVLTIGPEFDAEDAGGSWRVRRLGAEFAGGVNIYDSTQLRLGLFRSVGLYRKDLEINTTLPEEHFDEGGALASLRFDNLDNAYFPTQGGVAYAEYLMHRTDLGADHNFERWQALAQGAFSFGLERRNTIILTGKTGQSHGATQEPQNYFQLGGLFNLSGLRQDLLSGRQFAFAMAQYQRRLSNTSVLPIDMPVYLGASIEGGQLWSKSSDISSSDFINAGSIYLGLDSPIGPIYLAYGRSEDSLDALYLSLGWPILSRQIRIGR